MSHCRVQYDKLIQKKEAPQNKKETDEVRKLIKMFVWVDMLTNLARYVVIGLGRPKQRWTSSLKS